MAFRSFAIASALFSVVLAQSNPYIPPGISEGCATYLNALNEDTDFEACTSPFTSALEQFAPGANTPAPSSSTISTLLKQLCSSTAFNACPQSTVTSQLSSFYAACEAELTTSPNPQVKINYDVLYTLVPIREAICALDDSEDYCVSQISNSSNTGSVALTNSGASLQQTLLGQFLYTSPGTSGTARRDASNSTPALVPNTTTYQDTNLLFMFLEPSMPNSVLCTTCTRNVITPYITFESNCPYAPGMINSLLLAGQVHLYGNITGKCGPNFLSGAVQAAGGLSGGLLNSAVPRVAGQEFSAAVGAILGAAALVIASL